MLIKRKSPISGKETILDLDITEAQWHAWNRPDRPHIQHVFPHLTAGQREFILTGITEEEWEAFTSDMEEEEDDLSSTFNDYI